MSRSMFIYTKVVLDKVSFDPFLFYKELEKAMKLLLPYEIEELANWLLNYIKEKPELKGSLVILDR